MRALDGEYKPGQTIFIKGFVLGERFDVNVQAGTTDGVDIGLHLSCRLKEGKFVANTLQGGQWGKEERHSINLKENQDFELRIRAHEDKFEVFSQGKELFSFDYRLPLIGLTHMFIDGAVELHRVSWEGRYYEMPFEVPINLVPGKAVYVAGVIDQKANRFAVNLKADDDFALHLNPRFDEKVVVRNFTENGKWGNEERDGKFTLQKNRTFDIIIGVTDGGYELFLDGVPYANYSHRIDLNRVNRLTIEGDVELQGVHW